MLTDGLRKREVQFGRPGQVVATMTEDEPYQASRVAHDYLPDNAGALSAMRFQGVSSVRASSAGSDFGAFLNRGPEHAPWYALDGDPATSWLSGSADGALGQWFEVRYPAPRADPAVTVQFARQLDDFPTSLSVQTDAGAQTVEVTPDAEPQQVRLPAGPTQRLRLTVASLASGTKGVAAGLASVSIPGLDPQRSLQIPEQASPDVLSFRAASGYRTGCVAVASSSTCVRTLARAGEEQDEISRSFTLTEDGRYTVSAAVLATPGAALNRELDRGSAIQVLAASSTSSTDPRERPGAVLDGLPGTTWSATAEDQRPRLTLRLGTPSPVTGLVLQTTPDAPVSRPVKVRISAGNRSWDLSVSDTGAVRLPDPVRTATVELEILESAIRISSDELTGAQRILPPGISEVQVIGGPRSTPPSELVLECGRGPVLSVDGRLIQTSVRAPRAAVLAGAELQATPCQAGDSGDGDSGGGDSGGALDLAAGPHVLTLSASAETVVMGLRLTRGAGLPAGQPFAGKAEATRWGATERTVTVSTEGRALLVVHENFNAGWQAGLGGQRLTAVRVDGWQQAFLLPAGSSGTVKLSYAPDRPYKAGLLAGALAVVALLALAWRRRPPRTGPAEFEPAEPEPAEFAQTRLTRPELEPAGLLDARPAVPVAVAVALASVTLLAGVAGLITGLVVLALWWQLRRSRWLPWTAGSVAGLAVVLAGVLSAAGPSVSAHPLTDLWLTQWLVLLALLAVAVSAVADSAVAVPAAGGAGSR